MRISVRLDDGIGDQLQQTNVNISEYVRNLITQDLKGRGEEFEKLVKKLEAKTEKKKLLNELKILGALQNILERIQKMAKLDKGSEYVMTKKAIALIEEEKKLGEVSDDVIDLMDVKIEQLKRRIKGK